MAINQPAYGARTAYELALCLAALTLGLITVNAPLNAQTHAGQYEQADIEYGARLYSGHCITCHGAGGDTMPGANLRSGRFRNAPTDRELTDVLRNGLPGTAMTPNAYSDSELTALVAYLRNMGNVDLSGVVHGDAARGRELFESKGNCGSCHRVNGRGPRSAPDLSNVGAIRTAATLQRSLLDPNEALLPINRSVRAVTRDGAVINGRRLNEDTFSVQLIDTDERLLSLKKQELREYTVTAIAAMPSYESLFSAEERADVVAYLLSLQGFE
ncbi:MAG TPA: c-type cytochrome [Gammaproteobacteria bacterium]|nr:c-type cytochrome [Gammaproteobacteria bacterium]